jgi:peptidoglycan LD-endopeptidase LytH
VSLNSFGMKFIQILADIDFHPVIKLPDQYKVFDFTNGYDDEEVQKATWGVGRYNERRRNMYTAPQYENRRFIHMGIDIWTPVHEQVYAAWDGVVEYIADHNQPGNYGPVIVLKHSFDDVNLYALHGHLTRSSIKKVEIGEQVNRGDNFARIGDYEENGNWEPHLHYQLSFIDPGEADMPGVVSEDDLQESLKIYPDPRIVLGALYD